MQNREDFENAMYFSIEQKKTGIDILKEWNLKKISNNQKIKEIFLNLYVNLENFLNLSEKREDVLINYYEKIEYHFKKKKFEKNDLEKFNYDHLLSNDDQNNKNCALSESLEIFDEELDEFNKNLKNLKEKIKKKNNNKKFIRK